MASVGDLERLNFCLKTLDSTDLGLSLIWLWTWSNVKNFMADGEYKFNLTELEVWQELVKAVDSGYEFSLEYGSEQNYEDVRDWLINNNIMTDMMFEEKE